MARGAFGYHPRVPTNRAVPLVRRERLEGPYFLLSFRHPEVASQARAGQFVMIKAGLSAEPPLRRPFSIMTIDPREETFTLFVKTVGQGSAALAALAPGELAQCLGPLGHAFELPPAGSQALLVAGGYGIAPFVLLSRELLAAGRRPRVFYGARRAAELPLQSPFAALGVPLTLATEDGSAGVPGRVTAPLQAHLDAQPEPAELLACGPDAMMHAVARLAAGRGLRAQVSLDPWMGCGVGTCLGCVVQVRRAGEPRWKYRCACTEGPVFDAADVVWPDQSAAAGVAP